MSFFENIFVSLAEMIERYEYQDFLESVTGVCALVATANSRVELAQRVRFDQVIKLLSRLHCFEKDQVTDRFDKDIAALKKDRAVTQKAILRKVKETIESKEDKELILKVCWAMGRADGEIDRKEQEMVEVIAKELGLNLRETFESY
ncbi:tellurite resistance TerB family protein [Terasakiella pusilla]|uniref:tellurite resistance TerB family protein n=1 Tax=Terasakiella pusilla TaxID=64973 RepID=UPI003AA97FB0